MNKLKPVGHKISEMFRRDFSFMLDAIQSEMKEVNGYLKHAGFGRFPDPESEPFVDIRLCVDSDRHGRDLSWTFRTGSVDFDQVHSEYCGASSITLDTDPSELLEELVNQVMDQVYL